MHGQGQHGGYGPFERKSVGRGGLKAAGKAPSIKAATRSATYSPSLNLPKMERMGNANSDIFMEGESGNIWWRGCSGLTVLGCYML